ncbi:MAG: metal ABC transporter ATP-binding protein [Rhodospirillaceae bacterium]|nr:metal ABC transporter ATP-binding protein [Rhodospirillaceae bacterium]
MSALHDASADPLTPLAHAATEPPLASGRDLVVRYGGRTVLDRVSIEVRRREVVSVIGPNGAGKTTAVRALLGLIKPNSGVVERAPGVVVGYVPQRIAPESLLPLTVRRFLSMAGRRARADAAAVLDEVGTAAVIDRQLSGLSGGEFRRVLLARALLRDPDLLVLDEPIQQVDFAGQLAMHQLIGRLRDRRGCGVLIVSHDLHLVLGATDRVVCINGHVCCAGEPEEVSRHPEYISLFGPGAAAGLAVYTHDHDHSHGLPAALSPVDADPPEAGSPPAEQN